VQLKPGRDCKPFDWGKELKTHIELEGDTKTVVDSINSMEKDGSTISHVVEDIKQVLEFFLQKKVSHVS
jgi:hypothetical protein